uniref:Fucosyltransferase n=1 Tax=Panagrolaimus sp. PS1159 TaxID=55785 RepID=A0AC35G800_9BILA
MRKVRRIRASFAFSVIALFIIIGLTFYIFSTKTDEQKPEIITEDEPPKLILQYTPIFRAWSDTAMDGCPLRNKCTVVFDKSMLPKADAVVFHVGDLYTVKQYPLRAFQGQKHVMYSMESPINEEKYLKNVPANFFDWTMTHLSSSHVHSPYGGYWANPRVAKENSFPAVDLPSDAAAIMKNKTIPGAFWLVSNCDTVSKREKAVESLSKYFRIDTAGACAKNSTMQTLCPKGELCYSEIFKYYFLIIIENTVCNDYITEKYWNNFGLPLIPIVMRKRIYEMRIPPKSYIAMDEFKSPKEMGEYLTMLTKNQTAYMEYFKWRKEGWSKVPWNIKEYEIGYCDLCSQLLQKGREVVTPISDITKWYAEKGGCEKDEFANTWK